MVMVVGGLVQGSIKIAFLIWTCLKNFVVFKTYPARFPLEAPLGTFFGGF